MSVQCNVAGIVLAGSADFKTELGQSDMFDGVSRAVPSNLGSPRKSKHVVQ